jgi:ABC-type lipoprotein release transport system permease subunit
VLLAAVGIALILGAVAGLYPAWRAARLAPAEALRMI